MNCMIAAIRCCDRVHGITFQGNDARLARIFRVMTGFFPVLESLELCHEDYGTLVPPSTFLRGSMPNLQIIKLGQVYQSQSSLSQLLSSAIGLVELSLSFCCHGSPLSTTLLLAYLQGFPCLRCLQLEVFFFFFFWNQLTCALGYKTPRSTPVLSVAKLASHNGFYYL
jgi:hypothetical protein